MDGSESPTLGWPVAAGLIVILLVAFLGGGVVVARMARSGGVAVTSSVALATPRPTSAALDGAGALLRRDETPTPVAATATPAPEQTAPQPTTGAPGVPLTPGPATTQVSGAIDFAVVDGTPQLLAPGAATPTPQEWWAQSGPVSPDLGDELNAAYERFWNVRAQVQISLDPGPLNQVEGGAELQNDTAAVNALRAQNQPQQINVQHHIQIMHATADGAAIRDDYVAYSVPVDPASNQPLTPTPTGTWHLVYHIQRLSGTWKVIDAIQVSQ